MSTLVSMQNCIRPKQALNSDRKMQANNVSFQVFEVHVLQRNFIDYVGGSKDFVTAF